MMATHPTLPGHTAPRRSDRFTTGPHSRQPTTARATRSRRLQASLSRPSADIAGRAVRLSSDIPAVFDAPLEAHHKAIGRWVAANGLAPGQLTRPEARRSIEQAFDRTVREIFGKFDLADLRVVVLEGGDNPPALAIVCDSVGQVDLGWIEKTNVLANTLKGSVAPVAWRARAYRALAETLSICLPLFDYDGMIEELSAYYWDGATDDAEALEIMVDHHGQDPDDLILPSHVAAKLPDFMLAVNAGPLKEMPRPLRARLKRLADAYAALKAHGAEVNAWYYEFNQLVEYAPEYEDRGTLPPMTLVPHDQFAMELDEVGRLGMEMGFQDIAGFCAVPDSSILDRWFTSLRLGAELLLAAQDLIMIDPTGERP